MTQKLIISLPLYAVEIQGAHETELIKKAAFWLSLPTKCPHCNRPLILNYRTPQTFEYYELRCTGDEVTHCVNLGESKGTHDLYYDQKKQWMSYRVGTVPDIRHNDDRATPQSASRSSVTPEPASRPAVDRIEPKPIDAAIVGYRNDLLKLIRDAKAKGIRTNLNPADVGPLEEHELVRHIERIGQMLLTG